MDTTVLALIGCSFFVILCRDDRPSILVSADGLKVLKDVLKRDITLRVSEEVELTVSLKRPK